MSIKRLFQIMFGLSFLFLITLGILAGLLFINQRQVEQGEKLRHDSYVLASVLRQTSDDLTRFARNYVVTGEPKFEKYYWDILAMRQGTKPWPEYYERIYWDFMTTTEEAPRPAGQTVSLCQLLKNVGITKEEFAKLAEAETNSNALVKTEEIAMNAVKGLYDDGTGKFTKHGEPNRAWAIKILFDEAYHREKAKIMKPIDDFFAMLEARTRLATEKNEKAARLYLNFIIGMLTLLFILILSSFALIASKVNSSFAAFAAFFQRAATGDSRISPGQVNFREFQEMAGAANQMVAERQKAEEALREMTIMQQAILDSANYSIISTTPAGLITTFNAAAQRWLGYTAEEVVGKITPAAIHDAQEVARRAQELTEELGFPVPPGFEVFVAKARLGTPDEQEWTYIRQDGSRFSALLSVTALRDSHGDLTGFLGIASDITERKQAEEKIRASEQRFRSLVETTSDWVWEIDKDGLYTYASPKIEDLLGYRPDEVIGKKPFDLMPAEEAKQVEAVWRDISTSHKPFSGMENIILHKDGRQIVLETSGVPVFDGNGFFSGYRGIDRDITKRRQDEEELKFQMHFIATLMETMPSPVFYKDASGRYTGCNQAFEEMFGKSRDEIIGKSVYDLHPKEIADKYAAMDQELLEHLGTQMYEWKVKTAQGLEKNVIFYKASFADASGKVAGLIGVILDITERTRVEEALRQSEAKLQSILRAAPIGIALASNRVIITANDALCRITGYERQQLEGQNARMLYAIEEDFEYVGKEHYRQISAHGTGMMETRWKRQNGDIIDILLSSTALDPTDLSQGLIVTALDITKRKQAEEANIRLAAIVESSDDAIIGKTLDGIITSWNHGAERIYGYAASEVLGRHISLLTPPDRAYELPEIIDRIRQGQRVEHLETVRLRKDGRRIDISLSISPIEDAGGRIIGISAIARDITKQKQAEAELRKLSRAVQESPAVVVITDTQGNIEYVNPKFAQITGYSFEEALGQNPRILKSGETSPEEYKQLWDAITAGREWRGVFHNKKKNGELYWESASISPIKDAHGVITNFIAVKEDITAIKEAQDELAKLSLVASKTDNAVIITDKDGLIEWANEGFTRMTGYTLPEVLGQKPGPILQGPLSDPETIVKIRANLKKKETFTEEILNYHKNGRAYWVSMDITPICNDRGELVRFISIQRDITQRKETEEALRQAKEAADTANRAKTEFLASMSHEIRTPMNAIIGMAELLDETPLNAEQRKFVDVFRSAGETLLNIINDILDLSKVEAGQITLEKIDFDLGEMVEKVCEVMALRAHEKGIELACRLLPEVPIHLVGDPGRLRQVLTNLLGNAIKFTEQGEVVLEVGLAAPENESGPATLLFSIRDTGIGIPPEKLDYIFEKFTQADTSTTRRYGGTGLGLPITKRLVELMGGRIWVESRPGRGSTFSFTLSLTRQPEPKKPGITPVTDLRGLRVLIVDDNTTNRLILRETLTGWGAVADEAPDGARGLAQLKQARDAGEPYPLVLLDYRMPGLDGFEVAQAIHEDSSLVGTTLMMLTSDSRGGGLAEARKLGLEGYLVKPVKRAELKEAINQALSRAERPAEAPSPPSVREELCPLRILLVDDSADNRLLVQAYLKTTPFQLDLAENGEVAVEKFKSGRHDLVLMDMQMPVMDGYTATRTIRAWESRLGLSPVPIIALTAFALKEEMQRSLEAGCNAHLTKPIKKAILLEAITKWCPLKSKES